MAVLGAAAGFRDVREWYTRVAILSRQVCLIEDVEIGQPVGTAFLVGPDTILTAWHVVDPRRVTLPSLRARFDFIASAETGELNEGKKFELAPEPIVASSPTEDLDLALVRLAQPIGERSAYNDGYLRGWVSLTGANLPVPGTAIAIFQHPEGGPLKLAMSTNSVVRYEERLKRILYRTDTSPGASGGPCFDIDWRFAAMHTGFAYQLGNFNMGVPANLIVDWLRSHGHGEIIDRKLPARMKHVVHLTTAPARGNFSLDSELKKLLDGPGEGQRLELKERATKNDVKTAKISERLLNTVAAFMNSREGGTLLIGVNDKREYVGIEHEYAFVNKQRADFDSYSMWLNSVIVSSLDVRAALNYFTISRAREKDKDICAIYVQPAEMPVFLGNSFYVRQGSQNSQLSGHDMLAFIATRWSWLNTQLTKTSAESVTAME